MRVALVHDYLSQQGGAERVLQALSEIWPEAPIFVLFSDKEKLGNLSAKEINNTYLHKLPRVNKSFQWYLPFMPGATERHNLGEFDLVISSTSGFAKGVITEPNTLHISYCHTPPRFLWSGTYGYVSDLRYNFLVKSILPVLLKKMRLWDTLSTNRVDHFIANSNTVKQRIHKYYRRDSETIYPPVDTHNFKIANDTGDYFVAGGRLVPYKRIDLAVKAFNRLRWPLKIFGSGPEEKYLKQIAKDNIEFLGNISEKEKMEILSRAKAFINPQYEDFGIVAVEAMASGRPVIAFGDGGARESIIENETGLFFHKQTWEELVKTLLKFEKYSWEAEKIKEHAENFSVHKFKENIKKFVADRWEEFNKGMRQEELLK